MSKAVKIGFCTDFSKSSEISLETLLFNVWSFECDIHLFHLVEDDNRDDSYARLCQLQEELSNSLDSYQNVEAFLFEKGESLKLIEFLNKGNYISVSIGITSFKSDSIMSAFIKELYQNLEMDSAVIPINHEVKIENKGMIGMQYEHLHYLYALRKYEEYFRFHYARLKILILSETSFSNTKLLEVRETIDSILKDIKYELVVINKSKADKGILQEIENTPLDYFLFPTDDYFHSYISNSIEKDSFPGELKFSLIRLYITPENIKRESSFQRIELKPV
ncbi:hypothetical protein [uncultured Arcticibacterium sp.]|uniref:hypothetical protein n=1 Tax=uncultured Arcticibacterium sp. TaxID=2173042 RepID=UPI0030F79604